MQLDMTKGRPLPVILKFTIPLIIGNVFQQLYNMVDTIIVGRYVGADALAAVGSTGTIMFLLTGFSQGITAGFFHIDLAAIWCQRRKRCQTCGCKRHIFIHILYVAADFFPACF